jgi:HEAT repeat protein
MICLSLLLALALPRPVAADVEPTFRHEPLKKLLIELKDDNVMLRRQAAITLGLPDGSEGKGGPRPRGDLFPAMLALVEAQQDKDMQVRANAMKSLGLLMRYRGVGAQTEERFEKISLAAIASLKDSEGLVKSAAAAAMHTIGIETEKGRVALGEVMKSGDAKSRAAAADAAKGVRPLVGIVPALAERLADSDAAVRLAAAVSLNFARAEAVAALKPLIRAMRDEDEKVAHMAAYALGSIGPAAAEAVPALIDAIYEPKNPVRAVATWSLGTINREPDLTIPALIGALSVEETRVNAFQGLAAFGTQARSAIPAILAYGRTKDGFHASALYALGAIEPSGYEYRALLLAMLFDSTPATRLAALNQWFREEVWSDSLPALAMLFKCDPAARQRLAQVFGNMGAEAKPVVPMLMELIGDLQTSPTLRRALVNAVNRIDPDILKAPGM